MLSKKKINMEMLKNNIDNEEKANEFMDKITNKLDDYALRRAYNSSVIKYNKKPNSNTKYMLDYFKRKLEERHLSVR